MICTIMMVSLNGLGQFLKKTITVLQILRIRADNLHQTCILLHSIMQLPKTIFLDSVIFSNSSLRQTRWQIDSGEKVKNNGELFSHAVETAPSTQPSTTTLLSVPRDQRNSCYLWSLNSYILTVTRSQHIQ
jgi:hypothetical protein